MTSPNNTATRAGWSTFALIAALAICGLASTSAVAAGCPNEQLRVEDNSSRLPECRSYELVSPPEKAGAAVDIVKAVKSAPSGAAVTYTSTGVFSGTQASALATYYLASRTATGWSSKGILVPQLNDSSLLGGPAQAISDDLTATLQGSAMALTPGAVQDDGNIYLTNTVTGERKLVVTSSLPNFLIFFESLIYTTYLGGSSDFSHVVFKVEAALTPDSPAEKLNIYDFTGGQLHLVGYLPDGSVDPNGSVPATGLEFLSVYDNGTKVFFNGASSGGLYMRENDTTTIPISLSQRAGDPPGAQQAAFAGASADGSVVFFTSGANLTEASETYGAETLYRYDLNTGVLADLTPSTVPGEPANIETVMHVSDDGAYVYFDAKGVLAPGAPPGDFFSTNLYVWHAGQGIRFIGHTEPRPGGKASPNGLHFALVSRSPLTSFNCSECSLLYDYDYATNQLRCVSCNPAGGPPTGLVEIGGVPYGPGISHYFPRAVLNDGRLFFDTTDRLLPADTNGRYDVYEWQDGALSLISGGSSNLASHIADVSSDGSDVFFRTGQQLVGQDRDQSLDLYDARVDGGFPAPPKPSECIGSGCQGLPSAPPIFATPPSVTFNGVGNFAPAPSRSTTKPKAKPLTRAQRLAKALKACRSGRSRKAKKQRAGCEARARKNYGPAHAVKQQAKQNVSRRAGR